MNEKLTEELTKTVVFVILAMLAIAMLIAVLITVLTWVPAKAEELSEISPINASYCALYSRQMVLIDALHSDKLTADSDVIRNVALNYYVECASILPTLLPLPAKEAGFDQWVSDIRDVVFMRARETVGDIGTEPAKENPDDEEWRRQCEAEYVSWNPDDGTVVRKGNPNPVRCPCGREVDCSQ